MCFLVHIYIKYDYYFQVELVGDIPVSGEDTLDSVVQSFLSCHSCRSQGFHGVRHLIQGENRFLSSNMIIFCTVHSYFIAHFNLSWSDPQTQYSIFSLKWFFFFKPPERRHNIFSTNYPKNLTCNICFKLLPLLSRNIVKSIKNICPNQFFNIPKTYLPTNSLISQNISPNQFFNIQKVYWSTILKNVGCGVTIWSLKQKVLYLAEFYFYLFKSLKFSQQILPPPLPLPQQQNKLSKKIPTITNY